MPAQIQGNIREDIESSADYYLPGVYAELSFCNNYEIDFDPLGLEFIPVSGVRANSKLFVVGLLAPMSVVTGKLQDRSASLGGVVDTPEGAEVPVTPRVPGGQYPEGKGLPDEFWLSYVEMCARLGGDPAVLARVLFNESHFNPGAVNWGKTPQGVRYPQAKGLNQFILSTFLGVSSKSSASAATRKAYWENMENAPPTDQLYWMEQFFKGKGGLSGKNATQIYVSNFGDHRNPDGSMYASIPAQRAWLESQGLPTDDATRNKHFREADKQQKEFEANKGLAGPDGTIRSSALEYAVKRTPPSHVLDAIERAKAARASGAKAPPLTDPFTKPPVVETKAPPSWEDSGSGNAQDEAKTATKAAKSDLNLSGLGLQYRAAQEAEIAATQDAIETMRATPPLKFLVNPSTFEVSSEQIVSSSSWSRNGPIIEHWGSNQDKLSFSGQVAAFFALDSLTGAGPGLTRSAAVYSASYQNFLSLWHLYRNNAGVYLNGPEGRQLSVLGSVYIYYDSVMYVGSFDTFSVTQDEGSPHTLEYNIEFTVRATFRLDNQVVTEPTRQAR